MKDKANRSTGTSSPLGQAVGHPVGHEILRFLAERGSASGKEIAEATSKPRSTVGDQLRRLEAVGLIESVAEETKRGTIERFFRGTPLAYWVNDDEIGQMGSAEKKRIGMRTVRSSIVDASAALAANTLDRRDDWCLGSLRLILDEKGWNELSEIHRKAIEDVVRVREESAERLAANPEEKPLRALSSVMLLELPPES